MSVSFCCGRCPLSLDLAKARANGVRVPRGAGRFDDPIECRLRPAPVFEPGYGIDVFPILSASDPGCHEGRLAAAAGAAKLAPRS